MSIENQDKLPSDAGSRDFGKDIFNFYRYLTPIDIVSKINIQKRSTGLSDKATEMYKLLYDTYLKSTLSGQKIIDKLKDLTDLPERGVGFNTAYIDLSGRATFLDPEYWETSFFKVSKSDRGAGQDFSLDSFYQSLCATTGDAPAIPATINVIRMPFLSDVRKNVDAISFFMNHIPPIFANQMVPYFDVEFQFDAQKQAIDKTTGQKTQYLNHPSILRFLLGSSVPVEATANSLTNVDRALLSSISSPIKAGSSKTTAAGSTTSQELTISGMELFTMPQTLTNMRQLNADGSGRLLDVKPFLPPATLTNASITISNTGPNALMQQASVEFKIHDRARLVEFSDFIRGPIASKDVTIWITFGWLAPRGRGPEDAYAKFINENMLTRMAFMSKNSSFSFDNTGLITFKLELVSKSVASLEQSRIDTIGTKTQDALKRMSEVLRAIRRRRKNYKNEGAEAAQSLGGSIGLNNNKEIRIFQILDAADAGNLDTGLDPSVVNEVIKNEIDRLKAENPVDSASLELMLYVRELYEIDGDTKQPKFKAELEKLAKDYANEKFKELDSTEKDPFLPRLGVKGQYGFFSEDLIKSMQNVGHEPAYTPKPSAAPAGKGGSSGGSNAGGAYKGSPKKKQKRPMPSATGSEEKAAADAAAAAAAANPMNAVEKLGPFGPPPPPTE